MPYMKRGDESICPAHALLGGDCYSDRFLDLSVHLSIFPAKKNEQKTSKNIIEGYTLSE